MKPHTLVAAALVAAIFTAGRALLAADPPPPTNGSKLYYDRVPQGAQLGVVPRPVEVEEILSFDERWRRRVLDPLLMQQGIPPPPYLPIVPPTTQPASPTKPEATSTHRKNRRR